MIEKINTKQIINAAVLASFWLLLVSFASAQNTIIPAAEIVSKTDEYMKAAVGVDGFSGTILIARNGQPIVNKGYGMANIELNVPNAPKMIFRLGSITKQFTSMAVMMLKEKGKLGVDDPICKYFTDCPAAWKPITIRNLLTHTSGIPNYTSFPDFAKTTIQPITQSEIYALLKDKPLEFAPGEKYAYSNSGYYLLGTIIEKASGVSYSEFLQTNIFTPLGMKNSGYDSTSQIIMNRAAGYARQKGEIVNADYMDMSVPYAAGALYSTTGDLLIWDRSLYTDKLVSRKSMDEIFTPFKGETGYAFGWNIGKRFERRTIGHGGGIYGFATQITRFPSDNVTVIVLCNIQSAAAGKVASDLAAIVYGGAYEIALERKEVQLDPKLLEAYAGKYQVAPNVFITITLENGKLVGQIVGQPKFGLTAESETLFFSRDVGAQFAFARDDKGIVTGLTLIQGASKTPAQRVN